MLICGQLFRISSRREINCAIFMCEAPRLGMSLNFLCICSMKLWFTQRGISAIYHKQIIKKCLQPAWLLIGRTVSTIRHIAGKVHSGRSNICHTWRKVRFTGDSVIFLHSKQDTSDMEHVQEMWNTDQKKIIITIVWFCFTWWVWIHF